MKTHRVTCLRKIMQAKRREAECRKGLVLCYWRNAASNNGYACMDSHKRYRPTMKLLTPPTKGRIALRRGRLRPCVAQIRRISLVLPKYWIVLYRMSFRRKIKAISQHFFKEGGGNWTGGRLWSKLTVKQIHSTTESIADVACLSTYVEVNL